jgi:hypothetical protein
MGAAILRVAAIVFRVCIGVPLLGMTGYVAGVSIDFAMAEPLLWDRCVALFIGLFFAAQAYVVCRFILFPFRRRMTFKANWGRDDGPEFSGALVPASPKPKLPTLSAAKRLPNEGAA